MQHLVCNLVCNLALIEIGVRAGVTAPTSVTIFHWVNAVIPPVSDKRSTHLRASELAAVRVRAKTLLEVLVHPIHAMPFASWDHPSSALVHDLCVGFVRLANIFKPLHGPLVLTVARADGIEAFPIILSSRHLTTLNHLCRFVAEAHHGLPKPVIFHDTRCPQRVIVSLAKLVCIWVYQPGESPTLGLRSSTETLLRTAGARRCKRPIVVEIGAFWIAVPAWIFEFEVIEELWATAFFIDIV